MASANPKAKWTPIEKCVGSPLALEAEPMRMPVAARTAPKQSIEEVSELVAYLKTTNQDGSHG